MKSIRSIVGAREPVTVDPFTTARDAARLMAEHHIGAVPVVDGGRLAGIFTEGDLMTRVVAADHHPATTPVCDVMTTDLLVAQPGDDCETCLRRMQQARVRHLLVLDGVRLVGIVSVRDLLAVALSEKDEAIMLLNAYVHYIPADVHARA